ADLVAKTGPHAGGVAPEVGPVERGGARRVGTPPPVGALRRGVRRVEDHRLQAVRDRPLDLRRLRRPAAEERRERVPHAPDPPLDGPEELARPHDVLPPLQHLAPHQGAAGRRVWDAASASRARPAPCSTDRTISLVPTPSCRRASTSPRSRAPSLVAASTVAAASSYARSTTPRSRASDVACASAAPATRTA